MRSWKRIDPGVAGLSPTTAAVSTDIDKNARVYGVTGAARCNGAALVSMQAGRLSPVPTQTAAGPTTGPTTAAVSTDIDENGGVCFGALGAECEARSSDWRSQVQWSGSGFDAGRSAIASTDSDCS